MFHASRARFVLALCTATVVGAPTAHASLAIQPAESGAAPAGEAHRFTERAVADFEAGRYEQAVENFERAYALDGNVNNLFNIGRVYEEAGDLPAAIDYYTRFLEQPGVSLEYREATLERLEVLERTLEATRKGEGDDAATKGDGGASEPPPPGVEGEDDDHDDPPPPIDDAAQARARKQRVAGWAVLGVGGVALVAGGAIAGVTASTASALADETDPSTRADLALRGQSLAPAADALLISGGTLALVGLVVALTAKRERSAKATALAPTMLRRGAGLSFATHF